MSSNMNSVLIAETRVRTTSGNLRRERKVGYIPGIVYGGGKPNQEIKFRSKELEKILLQEKGINTLIEIKLDGDKGAKIDTVMIHDIQRDPVLRAVIHADYIRISMTEKITADIPLTWIGEPQGVKAGGQLQPVLRSIKIECLPDKIPADLEIRVADLMIGDSITVADLAISPDYKVLNDPQETLVQVVASKEAEAAATIKPEEIDAPTEN